MAQQNSKSFYKAMNGNFSNKMRVPQPIVSQFSGGFPEEILLSCGPTRLWRVLVPKCDHGRPFFEMGWRDFVRDNEVEVNDLLVFRYVGKSRFEVDIFGTCGCLKKIHVDRTRSSVCIIDIDSDSDSAGRALKRETSKAAELEMEVGSDDLPEFFKVYITQHSFNQMLIPNEFKDFMGKSKSGLAELSVPCGETWRVELVDDGKDLYFINGWQAFVHDNCIRDGDFLFFKLHGNLLFSVIIFDETMCEKGMVYKCSRGEDGTPGAKEEKNGVKAAVRKNATPIQPEAGAAFPSKSKIAKQIATAVKPFFQKCITVSNVHLNFPCAFIREHSLSYKSYEKMVLRTARNSWEVNIINDNGRIMLCGGWPAFVRENYIIAGDICKFELLDKLEMMVHVARRQKRIKRKCEMSKRPTGVSQLELGLPVNTKVHKAATRTVPSSVNCSFISNMKKHNVENNFILNIPRQFIKENSLSYQAKEKMVLRTNEDSSWLVNIIKSGSKNKWYYSLCGGWAAFVHANNIKEGDTCKFELVNRLEMKVHIVSGSKQG